MNEQNHTKEAEPRDDERADEEFSFCGPGPFDMASCRGMMASCRGMMGGADGKGCPCGSVVKRHWLAFGAVLTVLALAFLLSQVGAILGIIAFTRTW